MNLLALLRSRFETVLQSMTDDPTPFVSMVRPSQDPKFGDYQANCAMPLSKQIQSKPNPRDLAAEIIAGLDVADLCDEPEVAGPGFVNLRLTDDWIQQQVNRLLDDDRLGHEQTTAPNRFVIDYSAPNIAKPMHVGHLRSTVIGNALCRVLAFIGHSVIGDNHIGDWGTQFGMVIYGYKNFLEPGNFEQDAVAELARLYRLVNQLISYHESLASLPQLENLRSEAQQTLESAESDSYPNEKARKQALRKLQSEVHELSKQISEHKIRIESIQQDPQLIALADAHSNIAYDARQEVARLHAGDAANRELWDLFVPRCLASLNAVYERMDIQFDVTLGESFYQPMLDGVVEDLLAQDIAAESDGAVCVFVKDRPAPFIVRKRDGAFNYATTDLATIKYRLDHFEADKLLYVVDARQSEHFGMLYAVARCWGYDQLEYNHVSFGTVLGDDNKPFKTRSGDTIGLESLLDESIRRARLIVDENDDAKEGGPQLDAETRADVAHTVGIGGLKYADLHHNRESDYVFSWDKMLAKTGDTATYMQYAYARIFGIFRKGNVDLNALRQTMDGVRISSPQERSLCLQLLRFPEAIDDVAADYRPNLLTQYLFETANCFSAFHRDCPVLKATEPQTRTSRLLLCDLTARTLKLGLSLLGIGVCEQM